MPALEPSVRAEKERQVPLFDPPAAGELPPLALLDPVKQSGKGYTKQDLEMMSSLLVKKLKEDRCEVAACYEAGGTCQRL